MRTKQVGSLTVSVVGLGCNNFGMRIDADQTKAVVDAALEAGITLFDTADVYGGGQSEEFLGRALGSRRDEAVIATKFGAAANAGERGRAATIEKAVEVSLGRLGTDRIDLYQMHQPDADTPIDETLTALDRLVTAGKVREIGCSNFSGAQVDEAVATADKLGVAHFVTAQDNWSLLDRRVERDVVEACRRHGLLELPYFPLASGVLTGKYRRGEGPPEGTRLAWAPKERSEKALSDKVFDTVDQLTAFATERDHSLLDLAMSWLASQPVVASVIAGATKPDQVRANVAAGQWQLSDDEMAEVDRLTAR